LTTECGGSLRKSDVFLDSGLRHGLL
jgi:hypothetical protein